MTSESAFTEKFRTSKPVLTEKSMTTTERVVKETTMELSTAAPVTTELPEIRTTEQTTSQPTESITSPTTLSQVQAGVKFQPTVEGDY
jgi:hypothetical protein